MKWNWYKGILLVILTTLMAHLVHSLPETVRICSLFKMHDDKLEYIFRYAIDRVNANKNILPKSKLTPVTENVVLDDSFHASKKVCNLLKMGVAAIFGPQSGLSSSHIQSIADSLEIPHIETRWDYKSHRALFSINLHPHPASLSQAYLDLVNNWKWKSFTIIYEDNQGLVRMQELLKADYKRTVRIFVRQLEAGDDHRPLLKEIRKAGETRIILDCSTENIYNVLKQAQEIGMMNHYYNYMITSLTEAALMYDAVQMFAKVLHDVDHVQPIDVQPMLCNRSRSAWMYGNSIIQYMKLMKMEGLTGRIRFDESGFRKDFNLDIIALTKENIEKIGSWNTKTGINVTKSYQEVFKDAITAMQNRTMRITTKLSRPYVMIKEDADRYSGNDKYEGYCIDLLREIANHLNFNYTIKRVFDNNYGNINKDTGEWNGMIKELIDQEADVGVGDITVTYDREQGVDFTMPFMNLGISILFKKPSKKDPNLFSFLSPLSVDVWLYMATAYLGVSVILFLLARFNPYDWENPHPCDPDPDELENKFGLLNSMWFTIGSLMQQGSDLAPKAVSTRLVAGIWWFFTLIMISSYTANLAAFLTVQRMDSPIKSVEDLAAQNKIKYGCVESGTTRAFFEDSSMTIYQNMWSAMESTQPTVFTKGNDEGVERVLKGGYAYIIESTANDYFTERICELTKIGGLLDSKSYGIATPPGSPFRGPLSSAILHFQEKGTLLKLKEKWWGKEKGGGKCLSEVSSSASANELGLANVGGVFVVLLGGMGLACVVGVMEFFWKTRKTVREERGEFWDEVKRELRFAMKCGSSKKPVVRKVDTKDGMSLPLTNYS